MRAVAASAAILAASLPLAAVAAAPDRVAELIGTWSCETSQNSSIQKTVSRAPDGSIAIQNVVLRLDGTSGTIAETYRLDPTTSTWSVSTQPDGSFPFGAFRGSGPAWTERKWIVTGTEPLRQPNGAMRDGKTRIVYTDLFPAGFRHEYQVPVNGAWLDASEEVCVK